MSSMDVYPRRSRSPAGRIDSYRSDDRDDDRGHYRRRSPDRRGGRMRSRSPPRNIDRYQPGRDRDGRDSRDVRRDYDRRRSPAPTASNIDRYVPGQDPPPPVVNPLPSPLTLEFQVGFTWFAEWWRKDQEVKQDRERQRDGRRAAPRLLGEREAKEEKDREREKIQAAYDEYKEKFQAIMARKFVREHKSEEWFKERYDADIRDPFRARLAEFRRGLYSQWESDLGQGTFDEFTLEGIYKAEADGSGGIVEKEEGEAPMANEILSTADLVPSRGGDLRDENADAPALLIKTIAPFVGREKLETFCKEHLGEGDNGFKWLSLSDPNPTKRFHRIGWVLLHPSDIAPKREDRGEDDEGDKMETEDDAAAGPLRSAVENINGKSIEDERNGSFTCHVGIHVPASHPRKKALWDLFSAPERVERDLQLAMRLVSLFDSQLGESFNAVNKVEERVEDIRAKGLLQPADNAATKRQDEEREEGEDEDEMALEQLEDEVDDEELLTRKKKLDLLVEYLRRVYNFCFFCVFESDSVHELARKCPGGHLRRPRGSLTTAAKAAARATAYGEDFPLKKPHELEGGEDDDEHKNRFDRRNKAHLQLQKGFNWVRTFEDKLFQLLEPESADLKKLGGLPVEEALEQDLSKHVKQEDESKWRCKIAPDCTKLFKGPTFWRKHVEKRHTEWFDELRKEIELVNGYALDPSHISLQNSAVAANGHFPMNPSMQNGTPRGFSLGTHGAMGNNFAAAMRNGAVDGIGPMRRGNRNNNRQQGPYDRQGTRRGQGGRLTPPRGMASRGRGGFPDAMTGGSAGTREAVAGRSLKSYEDLDAVDGGDAGGLDY